LNKKDIDLSHSGSEVR